MRKVAFRHAYAWTISHEWSPYKLSTYQPLRSGVPLVRILILWWSPARDAPANFKTERIHRTKRATCERPHIELTVTNSLQNIAGRFSVRLSARSTFRPTVLHSLWRAFCAFESSNDGDCENPTMLNTCNDRCNLQKFLDTNCPSKCKIAKTYLFENCWIEIVLSRLMVEIYLFMQLLKNHRIW